MLCILVLHLYKMHNINYILMQEKVLFFTVSILFFKTFTDRILVPYRDTDLEKITPVYIEPVLTVRILSPNTRYPITKQSSSFIRFYISNSSE